MFTDAATLGSLLVEMHKKSTVLQGWDAVLNMTEDEVNSLLHSHWTAQDRDRRAGKATSASTGSTAAHILDFELGSPQVELQHGKSSVSFRQGFVSASLQHGGGQRDDLAGAVVDGEVPMTMVKGACNEHSAVLDLASARLTAQMPDGHGAKGPVIASLLQDWMVQNKVQPVIATVDFADRVGVASLVPTSLATNVVHTPAGNRLLQLLISTQGSPPSATAIDIAEPVPASSAASFSLIISSKILIDIVVKGFNQGPGLVKLEAVHPPAGEQASYARIRNPMQFDGEVSAGDKVHTTHSATLNMHFGGSPTNGLNLTTHTSSGSNINLQLDISARFPLRLSGSDKSQTLDMHATDVAVGATGVAETAVQNRLESFLTEDIKKDMTAVSLDAVASFFLKNLKFPGNLPKMNQAELPGDLLIVGTFEKE